MRRKGFGLTLDAVISMMFILLIFLAMSAYRYTGGSETTTTAFINLHAVSEDVLDVMNKMGILDEIGQEWTSGNESGAANLTALYLDEMIPENMGYTVLFDGDLVASNPRVSQGGAIAKTMSMRLLAGYEKNRTSVGSVSRAFLTGIREKTSSVYAYFGGSVGQGELTKYIHVPNGADSITDAYMEVEAGSPFDLRVGSAPCGSYTPSGGEMIANVRKNLTCEDDFKIGSPTEIRIQFTGADIEDHYIAGGFVRVTYNTSLLNDTEDSGSGRYEFPGIDGFINHYSSFHVPGNINSMSIYLDFENNYTTFLKIGDVMVYNSSGSHERQNKTLDDAYLQTKLSYAALSEKTVPIRMGTSNVTQIITQGTADVILITELSESMGRDMVSNNSGVVRGCENWSLMSSDTKRISLAKCLDKQFVRTILNTTGNRVGLVGYSDEADTYHSLSTSNTSLLSHIEGYPDDPSGVSCLCCAINRAHDILNSQSQPGRSRYIIVMGDGMTEYCCGSTGWWWWAECDPQGTSTSGQFRDCNETNNNCTGTECDGAIDNAIWSAQRAVSNVEAVIHSVGFGPVDNCSKANYMMDQIAQTSNGSYCPSTDPAVLESCYGQLADDIVDESVTSQFLNISGGVTESVLYPTSYIAYNYDPVSAALDYGEVSLTYDTPRFNDNTICLGSFFVPSAASVMEARVTSYSSEHWTDYAHTQNSGGVRVSYRLSDFGTDYYVLGDPYVVNLKTSYIKSGENNTVRLTTGDSSTSETGCSVDNRAIITIKMGGSTGYGGVFPVARGCNWEVEFEDGATSSLPIPSDYAGAYNCTYLPGNISYSGDDTLADTAYRLFSILDLDDDGRLDIKFDANQTGLDTGSIGGVRSLWGPAQLKLVLWI